jgi:hypothetical protein
MTEQPGMRQKSKITLHLYETFTAFVENGKEYYYFGAKM